MIQDAIKTLLDSHATVAALATGGVLLDRPAPTTTPQAFDPATGRLLPLIWVEVTSHPQAGPYRSSGFVYVLLRCYAPTGRQAQSLADAAFAALDNVAVAGQTGAITWLEDGGATFLDRGYPTPEQFWPSRYRAVTLRGEE